MKEIFYIKARERNLKKGDLVLWWDIRREDKGNHEKIDNLWFGPFNIAKFKGNNTFILQNLEGEYSSLLVNGRYLKHYIQYWFFIHSSYVNIWRVYLFLKIVSEYLFHQRIHSPRGRHLDLLVLCIPWGEAVPSWSQCCNII